MDKNGMQIEVYGGRGIVPGDFRSYSTPHGGSAYNEPPATGRDFKLKKGRSISGSSSASTTKNGDGGGGWGFNDPEFQRKKRVASYKAYSVESKMKGSFRKSFRWLKDRFNHAAYGWR